MKKLGVIIAVLVGVMALFPVAPVEAQGIWGGCDPSISNEICGDTTEAEDVAKRVINVFLFAIGALSVIMIIHSGLKYVTSRGDAEQVKSAKNTLLYAVIGLIVALLSFTIVNFVVDAFDSNGAAETGREAGEGTRSGSGSQNNNGVIHQ